MAKSIERRKARKLREKGLSIKIIAKKLGVSVGSVSAWVRDIKLSADQIEKLSKNASDPYYGGRLAHLRLVQKNKQKKIERLREEGIEEVGSISSRELFLMGVALYWAEGFKKDSQAGLASSDPKMITFFLRWLEECCGYKKKDLIVRVTLNASHRGRVDRVEEYWSGVIGIPIGQFQKPFYQKTKWKKMYDEPENYFGVLRVRVRKSTDFLRKVRGWIEGLKLQA